MKRNAKIDKWSGRIIWSADGYDWQELYAILKARDFPRKEVAVKLDRLFLLRYGLDTIAMVQKLGIPVFADAKIVEIPSKTMQIVEEYLKFQPWMLNVMANIADTGVYPGSEQARAGEKLDVLTEFATKCKEVGTKSCVVTVLTSKTPGLVEYEYKVSVNEAVCDYAILAAHCGVTDIVCSPREAEFLRNNSNKLIGELALNTPGVRLPESSSDDQSRVMSPGEALYHGADRLVIGRDLSRGGDFQGNLAKIQANIQNWIAE